MDDLYAERRLGRLGGPDLEQALGESQGMCDGQQDHRGPPEAAAQEHADQPEQEGQSPHAPEPRQLEDRAVSMNCVSQIGPGEAPEEVEATQVLGDHPGGGQHQEPCPARRRRQPAGERRRQPRVRRECQGHADHGRDADQCRRATVNDDHDVEPEQHRCKAQARKAGGPKERATRR